MTPKSTQETSQKVDLVKSAARVLDILELLIKLPQGLGLSEIGQNLNIPLSSLHGLMNTAIFKGYVVRDDGSSKYRVSPKLIQLAVAHHAQPDLVTIADPIMKNLNRLTGETVSLAILQDDMIVIIYKRSSMDLLQVVNPVGTRLPAHATGLGKMMLAYLDEEDVYRLYPRENLDTLTSATISTRTELVKALEKARELGYAFDNAESNKGVWAVAGAIRNLYGYPAAALSIAAPLTRVQDRDVSSWCREIKLRSKEISHILGYEE